MMCIFTISCTCTLFHTHAHILNAWCSVWVSVYWKSTATNWQHKTTKNKQTAERTKRKPYRSKEMSAPSAKLDYWWKSEQKPRLKKHFFPCHLSLAVCRRRRRRYCAPHKPYHRCIKRWVYNGKMVWKSEVNRNFKIPWTHGAIEVHNSSA